MTRELDALIVYSKETGTASIAGTDVAIAQIVRLAQMGLTPNEIQAHFLHSITLPQIHAALAYYYARKEEIGMDLIQDKQSAIYDVNQPLKAISPNATQDKWGFQLPGTLSFDQAIQIQIQGGLPVLRSSEQAQQRLDSLFAKADDGNLTPSEQQELDQFADFADYVSLLNQRIRNSILVGMESVADVQSSQAGMGDPFYLVGRRQIAPPPYSNGTSDNPGAQDESDAGRRDSPG